MAEQSKGVSVFSSVSIGMDCNNFASLSSTLPSASMNQFSSVSKIKKPFCAPAFSMAIFIKLASKFFKTISLDKVSAALMTVSMSKDLADRPEVVVEVVVTSLDS